MYTESLQYTKNKSGFLKNKTMYTYFFTECQGQHQMKQAANSVRVHNAWEMQL